MRKITSWPLLLLTVSTTGLLNSCSSYVSGALNPTKITPVITWVQPAPITNPTPLGAAQLDATTTVPGTFDYSPVAGTVLAAGTATLSTTFTPTDTAHYNTASASVALVINPATVSTPCPPPSSQPVTGHTHLAVADWDNSRVLIFNAPFTTGECASVVLGQADFDHIAFGEAPNLLEGPEGLGMDSAGNLYVADVNNGRVMQFRPPFASGMNASLELGVPGFSSPDDNNGYACYQYPPAMSLCLPFGVTVDQQGNVWVADTFEGRVVQYQPPIRTAMNASIAIGHQNLNETADCNGVYTITREPPISDHLTPDEFCGPAPVAFDSSGNLWVVDSGNSRILEFTAPFSTGMSASLELGYPASEGLTAKILERDCNQEAAASDSSLCGPASLAFDAKGNLWIADTVDNRILEFSPPFTNGMAAVLVVGQADFTGRGSEPIAANTLNLPWGVTFDSNGDMLVADTANNRVLIFDPPFSNGMSASFVIGQEDMATGVRHGCWNGVPEAAGLCAPRAVLTF